MHRSLTTTVPTQHNAATATAPDAASRYKQLTLFLGPAQRHYPQPIRMASATYQAPIARLPVELLSYIFLLGAHTPDPEEAGLADDAPGGLGEGSGSLHERSDDISPCASSSSMPPDVFAAVCRHWREVALNTPQLWTRVCVTIGDLMHDEASGWFPAVSRYVSRSGRCPLDIYIDARDPEWDFSENDSFGAIISPYIDETYDYTHPFRVEHMHYVLNILLPHIARVRSLAILTDRWAPMETALECLSFENPQFVSRPNPMPKSLPALESLVLMRCNEFVSYNPLFSPAERRDSVLLPFSGLLSAPEPLHAPTPVLPGLRRLTLSGVHLDWSSLPALLHPPWSTSKPVLQRLELSYHSPEVRPSEAEFRGMMEMCDSLQSLAIRVSGPRSPTTPSACSFTHRTLPVELPRLETFELGYDDVYSAMHLLETINFDSVKRLVLEDASSPARDETLDADPLLWACSKVAAPSSSEHGRPLFPRADSVILRRVEASAEAFEAFYGALPNLRELAVAHMFLLGGKALADRNVELKFVPPDVPAPTLSAGLLSADHEHTRQKSALDRPCPGFAVHVGTAVASLGVL
ncbi:hypothetical protein C8Q77DRAFT_1072572 [Trametes polyzona]|nr:hypothetical protein C8Q77DRAFT_1072572 [Trametes polyzona]